MTGNEVERYTYEIGEQVQYRDYATSEWRAGEITAFHRGRFVVRTERGQEQVFWPRDIRKV